MSVEKSIHVRLGELHQPLKDEAAALPGNVSLNTYIVTLLTNSPDRKRVRRAKGK